jgi:hypothetical protein
MSRRAAKPPLPGKIRPAVSKPVEERDSDGAGREQAGKGDDLGRFVPAHALSMLEMPFTTAGISFAYLRMGLSR